MRKKIKKVSVAPIDPITGSVVDTFNVNDKTTNAPSLRLMIDLIYPIGRGFIDFTDTDYSNWLGLTWERELVGMTAIGKNPNDTDFATVGQTGGEKTHTLTVDEIPAHTHYFNTGIHQTTAPAQYGYFPYRSADTSDNNTFTSETGGSQPHNNLPPYQVVSYWKRTA